MFVLTMLHLFRQDPRSHNLTLGIRDFKDLYFLLGFLLLLGGGVHPNVYTVNICFRDGDRSNNLAKFNKQSLLVQRF